MFHIQSTSEIKKTKYSQVKEINCNVTVHIDCVQEILIDIEIERY